MSTLRHTSPLASLGVLAAAALLSACASSPLPPPAATPAAGSTAAAATSPATGPAASGSAVRPAGAGSTATLPAQQAPAPAGPGAAAPALTRSPTPTPPQANSVYFAFDDFTLDNPAGQLVEQYGRYMAALPNARMRVEGHADERGGREYNLALGQKRAQAVVNALRLQGVGASALEAISYGKERPRALGHDEAAWAQNRRADLMLR